MNFETKLTQEQFEKIIFDDLGFCACGNPESAVKFICELLELNKKYREKTKNLEWCDKFCKLREEEDEAEKELFKNNIGVLILIVKYIIDNAKLTEHGGSVNSAWITEKGEEFLKHYNSIEDKENFI